VALFDGFVRANIAFGLAIGVGAAVVAPVVLPIAARAARPIGRELLKAGYLLYERGRDTSAELGEMVEDVVAEVRAEVRPESGTAETGAGRSADSAG
jgi:hypothetical protein